MTKKLQQEIIQRIEQIYPELVQTRRKLHQEPEISFHEYQTTSFIVETLTGYGYEVHQPLETGCVAVLKGGKESERIIALRADIDALPIEEEGEHKAEFLSRRNGVAHCCGHDVHTTNLLGVAKLLKEYEDEVEGTIVLIFQPAEEKLPGGGRLLSESGILQKLGVQEIYGLHTSPYHKPGEVAVKAGPLMARPDEFTIVVIGKGGHAAAPHMAVDPIVLSGQLITLLQSIITRQINPTDPAVLTIGKIEGGTAHNVIPEKVEMKGTVRTFDREVAEVIRARMEATIKAVTEAAGGAYDFHWDEGYPAVKNDSGTTDNMKRVARNLLGRKQLTEIEDPIMAGEDFAFYQEHFPGTFFFLGSGSEETGSVYPWHHPRYNVDERAIKTGVLMLAGLALDPPESS